MTWAFPSVHHLRPSPENITSNLRNVTIFFTQPLISEFRVSVLSDFNFLKSNFKEVLGLGDGLGWVRLGNASLTNIFRLGKVLTTGN